MPSTARPSSRRVAQGPQSRPARWTAGATRVTAAPDRRGAREVRRRAGEEAGAEAEPEASTSKEEEPKITAGGLAELIGFGLGLPVPASVELDKENWKVGSRALLLLLPDRRSPPAAAGKEASVTGTDARLGR